jgi:hypothetical protein
MRELTPAQARALRRRHKHERQAVVFGSLIAALALAGLGATAVYTGAADADFLDRGFTTTTPSARPEVAPAPCPPDGTLALANAAIQVNVLNSTSRAGLASTTAEALTTRGFIVVTTGNFQAPVDGTASIRFGAAGLAAAYTLAASVPDAILVLDTRADATIDLVLGTEWDTLVPIEEVLLAADAPLVGDSTCIPLDDALEDAPDGPTPTPTPTPTTTEPPVDPAADPATEG